MIDIQKAKIAFKDFLEQYEDKEHLSFKLKVVHTSCNRKCKKNC